MIVRRKRTSDLSAITRSTYQVLVNFGLLQVILDAQMEFLLRGMLRKCCRKAYG